MSSVATTKYQESAKLLEARLSELNDERAQILSELEVVKALIEGNIAKVPSEAKQPRTRRTKADMVFLRERIRHEIMPHRRHSSEIFADLVQEGHVRDIRKDRDQVMRELRTFEEEDRTVSREGDFYFEHYPSDEPF